MPGYYDEIMASPELSARLRYLNDSAHLLMIESPSTSRYMISRSNALMFDSSLEQSDARRQEVCGACGTIMVVGWQATVGIRSRQSRRGKDSLTRSSEKEIVLNCEVCDRRTRTKLQNTKLRHAVRPVRKAFRVAFQGACS